MVLNRVYRLLIDGRDDKQREALIDDLWAPESEDSDEAYKRLEQWVRSVGSTPTEAGGDDDDGAAG